MSASPFGAGRPTRSVVRSLPVLCLALAGCLPDTGDLRVGGDGGGEPSDGGPRDGQVLPDARLADGAPGDLGLDSGPPQDDPCLPEPTCDDGCPMPWLLAAIEDLPGGMACGGRVARLSVAETDAPCICSGYDGGGALPDQPQVVGFVPPSTLVTASTNGEIVAMDAATDQVRWSVELTGHPADVFALSDPDGDPVVGVAVRQPGLTHVGEVYLIDAAAGGTPTILRTNGDLPLGLNVVSMTQSTVDPLRLRALDRNDEAALDVSPWTGEASDPPYVAGRDGRLLATVYAAYVDGFHRTVWTGARTDLAGAPSRVWDLARADGAGDQRLPTEAFCDLTDDAADYDVECEYLHAVPDPTVFNQQLVLCQHPAGRRITRLRVVSRCLDVLEQDQLYDSARIAHLALALSSYWEP